MKKRTLNLLSSIAAISLTGSLPAQAYTVNTTTLYDSSSLTTPDKIANPYLVFTNPLNPHDGSGSQQFMNTVVGTELISSVDQITGYTNYNTSIQNNALTLTTLINPGFPDLNPHLGYTLSFTAKMASQTNNTPIDAGFDVILMSDQSGMGIDLGFRNPNTLNNTPDIFALDSNLTSVAQSNSNVGNILGNLTTYNLNVIGTKYTLSAGNANLLSGYLKNYSHAAGPASNIYRTANFFYIVDDSIAAGGVTDITNITLTTNVPEPLNVLGAASAIGLGLALKRWFKN